VFIAFVNGSAGNMRVTRDLFAEIREEKKRNKAKPGHGKKIVNAHASWSESKLPANDAKTLHDYAALRADAEFSANRSSSPIARENLARSPAKAQIGETRDG